MAGWVIAAIVLVVGLAYVAWEFRWYWSTLLKSWRNEEESGDREPDRRLARHL